MMNLENRRRIALDVLNAAADVGDTFVASACRRIVAACARGFWPMKLEADWYVVDAFHDALIEAEAA